MALMALFAFPRAVTSLGVKRNAGFSALHYICKHGDPSMAKIVERTSYKTRRGRVLQIRNGSTFTATREDARRIENGTSAPTFQQAIQRLQDYWASVGCVVMQCSNTEVGAGTMNPATFLRVLGPEPWNVVHGPVQICH